MSPVEYVFAMLVRTYRSADLYACHRYAEQLLVDSIQSESSWGTNFIHHTT